MLNAIPAGSVPNNRQAEEDHSVLRVDGDQPAAQVLHPADREWSGRSGGEGEGGGQADEGGRHEEGGTHGRASGDAFHFGKAAT